MIFSSRQGKTLIFLSPDFKLKGFLIKKNFLVWSCTLIPTFFSKYIKGPALPSMMGISGPSNVMRALSIPMPARADMRCSTVETMWPLWPMVVASLVSNTFSRRARMWGEPGRSLRQKRTPLLGGSGLMLMMIFLPVWRPIPVQPISPSTVRWCRGIDSSPQSWK